MLFGLRLVVSFSFGLFLIISSTLSRANLIGILVKRLLTSNETRMWLSLTFSKTFFAFSFIVKNHLIIF